MKTSIAIISALLLSALASKAQVFGSGLTITGTTNSAAITTNYVPLTIDARTIYLSQVSNTNETFIGSYQVRFSGTTNLYQVSALTNSFASGTNGGSWTTNIAKITVQVPIELIMQANIGNYTNQVYVP